MAFFVYCFFVFVLFDCLFIYFCLFVCKSNRSVLTVLSDWMFLSY